MAITQRERSLVLGVVFFFALFVGVFNLAQLRLDLVAIFFATLVHLIVLVTPLVLYREVTGWFHPAIFLPLWTLVTSAVPSAGVFIAGVASHSAVTGMSPRELNFVVVQGLLLQSLGWLTFYAGVTSKSRCGISLRFPMPRAVAPKILIVAGVSVGALVVLIQAAGGLDLLILERGLRGDQRVAAELGGHWTLVARNAIPTACLVWLGLRPSIVRRLFFWLVFCGGLFIAFAATGSRSSLVIPAIMALVIWSLRMGRVPYVWVALVFVAALVVVGVGGEFRTESFQAARMADIDVDSGVLSGFMRGVEERATAEAERSGELGILARVPNEVDLLYGRSYLSALAAPIPSSIWPDKPESGGSMTGRVIFGRPEEGGGVPPGTVGEAFWNFHVPGVILVFFLWGRFASWLASFYQDHARHSGVVVLYVLMVFRFEPNTVAFYGWLHEVVFALCVLLFLCGRPRVRKIHGKRGVSISAGA